MVKRIILLSIFLLAFGFSVSFGVTKKISGTTNVEDVSIDNVQLDKQYGSYNPLILYEDWEEYYRILIRVKNVASELGTGATNITAVCSVYCYSHERDPDTIYAYRVFKPWGEGNGTGGYCDGVGHLGATWGDWACLESEWGTAGCANASDAGSDNNTDGGGYDRKATPEGTGVLINANGWYSWTISTGLATVWYNGTANENGILLKGSLVYQGLNYFYSTEYTTDPTKCPFFVFTYDQAEQDTFALRRVKDDWRFLPSFIMDWRFQDSVSVAVAQVQKIFHGGANGVDTMYYNGVVQNIYK